MSALPITPAVTLPAASSTAWVVLSAAAVWR